MVYAPNTVNGSKRPGEYPSFSLLACETKVGFVSHLHIPGVGLRNYIPYINFYLHLKISKILNLKCLY